MAFHGLKGNQNVLFQGREVGTERQAVRVVSAVHDQRGSLPLSALASAKRKCLEQTPTSRNLRQSRNQMFSSHRWTQIYTDMNLADGNCSSTENSEERSRSSTSSGP